MSLFDSTHSLVIETQDYSDCSRIELLQIYDENESQLLLALYTLKLYLEDGALPSAFYHSALHTIRNKVLDPSIYPSLNAYHDTLETVYKNDLELLSDWIEDQLDDAQVAQSVRAEVEAMFSLLIQRIALVRASLINAIAPPPFNKAKNVLD